MEAGFSTLATASATLLGLVLVAVVFAFRSTFTRLDRISDFRDLAKWIWTSGFSCFLYFGVCLLLSFRMMETDVGRPALATILIIFSVALAVTHVLETRYLHSMRKTNPAGFKTVIAIQDPLIVIVFVAFEVLSWRAWGKGTFAAFELDLYAALTYTLALASFRSVALVVLSFRAITLLEDQQPAEE
ncbi:MAG: hypothetical protein ACYC99_10640 [Candidatus Geothermincolia bacterium]